MTNNRYKNAAAFRIALEHRLQAVAERERIELQRLRRKVAFNRFLARVFAVKGGWVLKGGYSMEVRLAHARATRDIDLSYRGGPAAGVKPENIILGLLQNTAAIDLSDYFTFKIGQLQLKLDTPVYGGARYPVQAVVNEKLFVAFHVDVALGDYIPEELETAEEPDWLSFAGITPAKIQMLPAAVQFAEKLHAYTLPRAVPNSRVRDMLDMLLLIRESRLTPVKAKAAVKAVFERRKTHSPPQRLDAPPAAWEKPFTALADGCGLKDTLADAFRIVDAFTTGLNNS